MALTSLPTPKSSEVVTWAVYQLGGDQRHIDTEDVAVKAFELAPMRFSWRKYPQQINLELVRVYLSDAKKPEHGKLLSGSGRTGWRLTRKGLQWVESARARLESGLLGEPLAHRSRAGSVDSSRKDREGKRIRALPAWARWASGDRAVVLRDAQEVFRLDSYATPLVRESKLTRLKALFADDDEMSRFLAHLSNAIDNEGD